ncbi:hypothetical protein TrVFT333_011861 [Trichoderma virens FT-333]|nr:hypothetical protein TrVFT333_011861 [Trichoderma virens FT-333]
MSRTKLPGPACATCRAKSRRCDRARPACGRCVSKNLECGGYPEKYRFCGLASRGKWKNRQAPIVGDTPKTSHVKAKGRSQRAGDNIPISLETDDMESDKAELGLDRHGPELIVCTEHPSTLSSHHQSTNELLRSRWLPVERHSPQVSIPGTRLSNSPISVGMASVSASSSVSTIDHTALEALLTQHTHEFLLTKALPESTGTARDDALVRDQINILLSHYDSVICPHQIQQFPNDATNPYRAFILPLAYEQFGLLYAVLGLAANHLGHLNSDKYLLDTVAVEYRSRALKALSDAISKGILGKLGPSERDSIFAIIQMLLLHDISESGISEHGIHISGAVSICCRAIAEHGLSKQNDSRSIFFLGNLVWLDIIRAFAHPERLCFPTDVREFIIALSDNKLEMVNGCPREIMLLMGEALDRAKAYAEWKIGHMEYSQAIRAIIRKLYSWNSSRVAYPTNDPLWLNVAETFRHACILRSLRLLDDTQPAEDPEIQESVTAILDAASVIPGDNALIELLIMPLFMAGADSLSPHSRHYVLLRFVEIKARGEMSIQSPRDLLHRVWEARSKRPEHDRTNVPWMIYNEHTPTDPNVIFNMDFFASLGTLDSVPESWVEWVNGAVEAHVGAEQDIVSDRNQAGIKNNEVEIEKSPSSNLKVDPVVN